MQLFVRWIVLLGCLSTVAVDGQNPFLSSQPGYPDFSPFEDVRWEDDAPIVKFEGNWYRLKKIHGVTTEEILQHCREKGWPVRRRFTEDLVQILRLMGKEIDQTTSLVLETMDGQTVERADVKMTKDNLRRSMTGGNPFLSSVPGYPTWSPFEEVRWEGDKPKVRVDGKWFTPKTLQGVSVDAMLRHSDQQGWNTKVRFVEDTVQMLRLMGTKINRKIDMELVDESGKLVTFDDREMKEGSRARYSPLAPAAVQLNKDQLTEDLDSFRSSLTERFAYLNANGHDYEAELSELAEKHPDGIGSGELSQALQRVMMGFIDGHAGVRNGNPDRQKPFLSFRVEDDGEQFVAVQMDRKSLVEPDFPYLRSINGVSVEEWIEKFDEWIADGSPQMVRRRGLGMLSRNGIGGDYPDAVTVELELVSRDGQSTRRVRSPVRAESPRVQVEWPSYPENGLIEKNIGYLRLPSMNSDAARDIAKWMPEFKDADGLIVDVRGNGGGIRTPILELSAFLLSSDDTPRIGNVAKYRLAADRAEDHLSAARYVYRIDSPKLDQRDRMAVTEFAKKFRPQWDPPADQFSDWHYLVLSKKKDDARYQFRGPVLILMDTGCFSATDIFLGTFQGWPNVTLVGQPSGGGSARTQSFRLPNSGIPVRCASMASFQPNGKLYDTNGVMPDVRIRQVPEYFTVGGPDLVLETAKKAIVAIR